MKYSNHIYSSKIEVCLLIVFICSSAQAGIRRMYSDDEIIQKSELIVLGHLQTESIHRLDCNKELHKSFSNPPALYTEYEAILEIGKIIKGNYDGKILKIVVHGGLDIIRSEKDSLLRGISQHPWKGGIEIWDTGNSLLQAEPIIEDAQKNAIWFLANHEKDCVKDTTLLGIVDPEDIQQAKYMDFFKALMAADQEQAVKELVLRKPEFKERAEWFFEKWEISKLVPLSDCKEKITRLVPYLNWATCENVPFADRRIDPLIFNCGTISMLVYGVLQPCEIDIGPTLTELWKTGKFSPYRQFMARFIAKARYLPAVPLLEELAKEENHFFATHPMPKR